MIAASGLEKLFAASGSAKVFAASGSAKLFAASGENLGDYGNLAFKYCRILQTLYSGPRFKA